MDGLLLVHKSTGMTSTDVVRKVRKLANQRQVGHTGTLDPEATGLLPIALGAATKLSRFLTLDVKTYVFDVQLGQQTDTLDHTGSVVERCPWQHVSEEVLRRTVHQWIGQRTQVPPAYSAIRINGKRAHQLAREGKPVKLDPRPIEILDFALVECRLPHLAFRATVSVGTYVRCLARDLAHELGTCAHTTRIHRERVGPFELQSAYSLEQVEERGLGHCLLTPADMLKSLPFVVADAGQVDDLRHGRSFCPAMEDEAFQPAETVAVVDTNGLLIAVTEVVLRDAAVALQPKRVLKPT